MMRFTCAKIDMCVTMYVSEVSNNNSTINVNQYKSLPFYEAQSIIIIFIIIGFFFVLRPSQTFSLFVLLLLFYFASFRSIS